MEEPVALVDTLILAAGMVLILLTSVRVSRRRSSGKAKGETGALIGILVWLGCLGVALYLIFG